MEEKHHHHHHHKHKKENKVLHFIKKYKKEIMLASLIFLLVLLVFLWIKEDNKDDSVPSVEENEVVNYDAIITVIDGEGESSFTETWGELIYEGYPICSDLVTDYVGNEGFMDWDTIIALDNIGVEFVFHSSNHADYNAISKEEVINDIERGIKAMEEHGLEHRMITWLANSSYEVCELGKEYFDGGITDYNATNTVLGDKSNPMMIGDIFGSSDSSYFSYEELRKLINTAIENNGWVVLFTRNNHKMMDETQINEYRRAFEYAKDHNVGVVTASEGFDLYYGNKLGNNN